ncbi:DNA-packaging protein [Ponticaulis profundi]|uniref:DNA-packaging protein n=1 Tax=Ponticaulis profundi TaxID=2665222 RepID=UPI00366EE599
MQAAWVRAQSDAAIYVLQHLWAFWARQDQLPPSGDWRSWLFMGGRGAGKTRAGAEWLLSEIQSGRARRIALVGATMNDVREVMIGGESGLLSLGLPCDQPSYEPSRQRLSWPNGAVGYAFSAEEPERLRGPQFDTAWVDEVGAWSRAEATWNMLQFGLRLGKTPRVVATTTPRTTKLIRRLVREPGCTLTHAKSEANAANLAPHFLEAMRRQYGHSSLGRQELDGELVEEREDALFRLSLIDAARVQTMPELDAVVIAVDPPAMAHARSDACGIVAVGRAGGDAYLLADETVQGVIPDVWAARIADLADVWGADEIIAEANQGGEMVRSVIAAAGTGRAIRLIHARVSKRRRAGPVAALYGAGRIHHVGHFKALEDEMIAFGEAKTSPNRLDALVWGVTQLLLKTRDPRIALM